MISRAYGNPDLIIALKYGLEAIKLFQTHIEHGNYHPHKC